MKDNAVYNSFFHVTQQCNNEEEHREKQCFITACLCYATEQHWREANGDAEKQCITVDTLCYATVHQWRVAHRDTLGSNA